MDKKCNVWVHIAKEHPNKIVHLSKTRMQYGEFQDDSLMELLRCFGKFDILIIDGVTADNKGIYMRTPTEQSTLQISKRTRHSTGPMPEWPKQLFAPLQE